MTEEMKLKEELLEQGRSNGTLDSTRSSKSIQEILAKDEARVKRMRLVTKLTWLLALLSLVAACAVLLFTDATRIRPQWVPAFLIAWQFLLIIAASFSVSLYVRSRTLTMHQIQARLASIEEQLKKMAQEK